MATVVQTPRASGPWTVFAVAASAVFIASLDATIAVAAFPALRAAFPAATPADLSWVLNAYTILYAALLVPAGRLVDLHGASRLFLAGVAFFTAASLACGLAPNAASLIAARMVQAAGGAIFTPSALALILGAFPAERRTAVVGMLSGVGALGAAVGPGIGGLLIELAGGRAAFLVNLPAGALILAAGWRHLPRSGGAAAGEGLDLPGVVLIVAGAGALAYGIVQVEALGPAAPAVWGSVLAGAASLVAFAMLFLGGFLFLLQVWGFGQALTGLAVMPGPLVAIVTAVSGGRIVGRLGHRGAIVAGVLLFAVAQTVLGLVAGVTPAWLTLWFPMQVLGGAAVGLLLVGLSGAAVAGLAPARFGFGGAVNNAVRQMGGVIGTALAVVLVGGAETPLAGFQSAFLVIGALSASVAALALTLPGSLPQFAGDARSAA